MPPPYTYRGKIVEVYAAPAEGRWIVSALILDEAVEPGVRFYGRGETREAALEQVLDQVKAHIDRMIEEESQDIPSDL